jgi:hypothetical protein
MMSQIIFQVCQACCYGIECAFRENIGSIMEEGYLEYHHSFYFLLLPKGFHRVNFNICTQNALLIVYSCQHTLQKQRRT